MSQLDYVFKFAWEPTAEAKCETEFGFEAEAQSKCWCLIWSWSTWTIVWACHTFLHKYFVYSYVRRLCPYLSTQSIRMNVINWNLFWVNFACRMKYARDALCSNQIKCWAVIDIWCLIFDGLCGIYHLVVIHLALPLAFRPCSVASRTCTSSLHPQLQPQHQPQSHVAYRGPLKTI